MTRPHSPAQGLHTSCNASAPDGTAEVLNSGSPGCETQRFGSANGYRIRAVGRLVSRAAPHGLCEGSSGRREQEEGKGWGGRSRARKSAWGQTGADTGGRGDGSPRPHRAGDRRELVFVPRSAGRRRTTGNDPATELAAEIRHAVWVDLAGDILRRGGAANSSAGMLAAFLSFGSATGMAIKAELFGVTIGGARILSADTFNRGRWKTALWSFAENDPSTPNHL